MEINKWRLAHLAAAEAIDSWRLVPRLLIAGYSYLLAYMVHWYMQLKPYILEQCVKIITSDIAQNISSCIIDEPSTQHTALITAVIGISAGVFGFYTNSGRNWTQGVYKWPMKPGDAPPMQYMPPYDYNNQYNNYNPYDPYNSQQPYNPQQPYVRPTNPPAVKPPPGDDL